MRQLSREVRIILYSIEDAVAKPSKTGSLYRKAGHSTGSHSGQFVLHATNIAVLLYVDSHGIGFPFEPVQLCLDLLDLCCGIVLGADSRFVYAADSLEGPFGPVRLAGCFDSRCACFSHPGGGRVRSAPCAFQSFRQALEAGPCFIDLRRKLVLEFQRSAQNIVAHSLTAPFLQWQRRQIQFTLLLQADSLIAENLFQSVQAEEIVQSMSTEDQGGRRSRFPVLSD